MATALEHKAHALQQPMFGSLGVVHMKGQPIVVLEIRPESNTVLELLVQTSLMVCLGMLGSRPEVYSIH
eukprot:3867874-Alexandrium_andersonii.AAC.1